MTNGIYRQQIALQREGLTTSKVIVLVAGIIYTIHLILSCALILMGFGELAVALMTTSIPVYLTIMAGYFGKAYGENVQKIKNISTTTNNKSNG